MKKKRLTAILLALLLFAGCAAEKLPQPATPQIIANPNAQKKETADSEKTDEALSEEELPETIPILEEIVDETAPMLTSLQFDDAAELPFSPALRTYTVCVPAGHPRLGRLLAEAEDGLSVTVADPVIADGAFFGYGYVTVQNAQGQAGTYTVMVVKDETLGYRLQYGDYDTFTPDCTLQEGQTMTFSSSAPEIVSVNERGQMIAKSVSDQPVTISAQINGKEAASRTVDAVDKAPIDLFFITGQSNASGYYDTPAGISETGYDMKMLAQVDVPKPGTVFCSDYNYAGNLETQTYDLNRGRKGFSPALGKKWYALTGEKSWMLQTAMGGAPIEAWAKPEDGQRTAYLARETNLYENTQTAYDRTMAVLNKPDCGYELRHVFAYWLQGETGMDSRFDPDHIAPGIGDWVFHTDEIIGSREYYDLFCAMEQNMEKDFGVEFMGILLVRGTKEACSLESFDLGLLTDLLPTRAAQYALHNHGPENTLIVSRVCDIATPEFCGDRNAEGWGYMGVNNLHYNQSGHNANGIAAAENTFLHFYDIEGRRPQSVEVLKENGRDRFSQGEKLCLSAGQTYQTAACVLPLYTDNPDIEYEVADESVCTVDDFGMISVNAEASGKQTVVSYRCKGTDICSSILISVQ